MYNNMIIMLMPYITTATELQRNYKKVAQRARKVKDVVVVLSNNAPEGVYIDYNTFLAMMSKHKNVDDSIEKRKLLSLAGSMDGGETDKLNKDMDEMFERIDKEVWE